MSVENGRRAVLLLSLSILKLFVQHASAKPLSIHPRRAQNSNGTYITGPVMQQNFPDPSIIYLDGEWWAFATMDQDINIQVAHSPDFEDWTYLDGVDALPDPPGWVNMTEPNTWAPDVNQLVSLFPSPPSSWRLSPSSSLNVLVFPFFFDCFFRIGVRSEIS